MMSLRQSSALLAAFALGVLPESLPGGAWIDRRVAIQPIVMRSTDGSVAANPQLKIFEAEADKIWAQAGIDLQFLPVVYYDNSLYTNVSTDIFQPNSFYSLALDPGHRQSTDPQVINLWFVRTVNSSAGVSGFSLQSTENYYGTLIEQNGVSIADSAFAYGGGAGMRDIFAYEVARNLGLDNGTQDAPGDPNNLMKSTGPYPTSIANIYPDGAAWCHLTPAQVIRARAASFARLLPETEQYEYPVTFPPTPPVILTQPPDVLAAAGQPARLRVVAWGTRPLYYQWQHSGTNLPANPASDTLAWTQIQFPDAGDYQVLISNRDGSVTSRVAAVVVITPPTLTRHPQHTNVAPGATVAFSVEADGTPPLSFQWRMNELLWIQDATNHVLVLTNVTPGDAGAYSVEVCNGFTATSSNGVLTVGGIPRPALTVTGATNHACRLQMTGMPFLTFRLESTGNLPGDLWHPLGSLTPNYFGEAEFTDPAPLDAGQRFYRLVHP